MKSNPWIKLVLISLGGVIIGLALLWSLQQINYYTYYSNYNMQGEMRIPAVQQKMDIQMDNRGHMSGMMNGM